VQRFWLFERLPYEQVDVPAALGPLLSNRQILTRAL